MKRVGSTESLSAQPIGPLRRAASSEKVTTYIEESPPARTLLYFIVLGTRDLNRRKDPPPQFGHSAG